MTPRDPHPDVAEELRLLAQAILDRLDPALRAAAARAAEGLGGPGRCQQVWCPVCALAAAVTGEQHPLLTVIAEHSVALLTVIRSMTAQSTAGADTGGAGGFGGGSGEGFGADEPNPAAQEPPRTAPHGANGGGYHPIAFTVEPVVEDLSAPSAATNSEDPAVP